MPPVGPAILNSGRVAGFRLAYIPAAVRAPRRGTVRIFLGGVLARDRVRRGSLTIHDLLNDAPNTCEFVVNGAAPANGTDVRVTIDSDVPRLLFNGIVQDTDAGYALRPRTDQRKARTRAIDDTARVNRRRPFGAWTDVSATTIVHDILTRYAPGFTGGHVEAGLDPITISFDGSEPFTGCLRQIVTRIGGYFYFEDGDLHLFVTPEAGETPDPIVATSTTLHLLPSVQVTVDDSQVRNRVFGQGFAEKTESDVAAGDTIVPLTDAALYTPTGGRAIVGAQIVTYTGLERGNTGALVGPGATPSAPLAGAPVPGTGLGTGLYGYAYTFVTAAGESLPSPVYPIAVGVLPPPTTGPTVIGLAAGGGAYPAYGIYAYVVTFVTATGETVAGPPGYISNYSILHATISLTNLPIGPTGTSVGVTARKLYRTVVNGAAYFLVGTIADNVTATYVDALADSALGAPVPTTGTATANQVRLRDVALGPDRVTARNLYRTAVNGSQLRFIGQMADNLSTVPTSADATPDGSLGVAAPTSDTSGLDFEVSSGAGFYTSGVNFATDGSATGATTAAPVFGSASYNFIAADVGADLYIRSGTGWTPGRYRIVSVATNFATLAGACGTIVSPFGGTWGIDYSVQPAPHYTFADLAITISNETQATCPSLPVKVNWSGNVLNITGGLGFVVQRVVVVGVSGTTIVGDKSFGTLGSTGGQGTLGGTPPPTSVPIGSTSIAVAGPSAFAATGGWVQAGNDRPIRYTGISGNRLTGIPASGLGSVQTVIPYNRTLTLLPALTGVTGLLTALPKGAAVHVWVQREDVPAQAALAAIDAAQGRISDGVVENKLREGDMAEAELVERCDAELAMYAAPLVTVTYETRDPKSKSGRPVVIDLPTPAVHTTLVIQEVTITEIDQFPGVLPRCRVVASNVRFSLEDLLRRMAAAL